MEKKTVSGIMLTLLLASMLVLAFNIQLVNAQGTIYIRADGSIDPPTAPITTADNVTYAFTGNIGEPLVVERDNIIVDGTGYMVSTFSTSTGIDLSGRDNVTIKGVMVQNCQYYGISLNESSGNTLIGCSFVANGFCVFCENSDFNNFTKNNMTGSWLYGLFLKYSSNNIIHLNNLTSNYVAIELVSHSSHNNVVENQISNNRYAVDSKNSSNNAYIGNTITNNTEFGLGLYEASNNNTILRNRITNNTWGIPIVSSSYNVVSENEIVDSQEYGLGLRSSSHYNTVTGNTLATNQYGLYTDQSSDNIIYHNNFIVNTQQVWLQGIIGYKWDDGYPSGGNYWSDYSGSDLYYGPYQNETGSDGIGDSPYVIDASNQDNYPLMSPYNPVPWDVTGPVMWVPDRKCDIRDIAIVAIRFGSVVGDAKYDRRADITGPTYLIPDLKIDIRDIALVAIHFGETYS